MQKAFTFFDTSGLKDDEIHLAVIETLGENESQWRLPAYRFNICLNETGESVGYMSLRIGDNEFSRYIGHIGYEIDPDYRGNNYSLKAAILALQLARRHGMGRVTITANPDNFPSRHIIEKMGAKYEGTLQIPPHLHSRF